MGEFELIRRCFDWSSEVSDGYKTHPSTQPQSDSQDLSQTQLLLGIGDDAALIKSSALQAICTDSLIEGTHFVLSTPSELIGYKSLAVNLSDLAAMGANPSVFLLAIGLPSHSPNFDQTAWLKGFAQGLKRCADEFGVKLIGGDTTRAPQISITITALGECASPLKRSSLKPGMHLAVSGSLGGAAHALKNQELTESNALNQPTPRNSLGIALGRQQLSGAPIACIDISDGLLQDLSHLLEQSCKQLKLQGQSLCAELKLERLPAHLSLHKLDRQNQLALMLTGGEDYELLIGYDPDQLNLLDLQQQTGIALTDIGEITLKAQSGRQAQPPIKSIDGGHFEDQLNQPCAKPWHICATLHNSDYPLPKSADWGYDHFKSEHPS